MPIQVTKITSVQPNYLSKVLGFEDGEITKSTRANLVRGRAEVITLASLREFQRLVLSLNGNQALCYGVPNCAGDSVDLVTRDMWEQAGCPATVLPRCNDTFSWPDAGILMLDYDPKGDPLQPEDLDAILKTDVPGYGDVDRFIISSSSGHIWKGNEELVSSSGLRVYIPVSNAADIPVLGDRIVKYLWATSHGFQQISRSGAQLNRTLVDATVWQPSRLDFAAGAICKDGLEQRRGEGNIIRGEHRMLDSEKLPAPTPEEQEQATRNIQLSKKQTWPEAQEARFHYIQTEKVKLAGPNATHAQLKRAGEVIHMALNNSQLHSEFKVYLQLDGETVCVTVGQLLADPDTYHGAACLDPLEPEYNGGAWVGKVYLDDKPNIHSFAHGGKKYWLMKRLTKTEESKEPKVGDPDWLEKLNAEFAIFPGNKAGIIQEKHKDGFLHSFTVQSVSGFRDWMRNRKDEEGKGLANQWLSHPKRREYPWGITFDPSHVGHYDGFYNLYQGWRHEPSEGNAEPFWQLLSALVSEDADAYWYIRKWLAHLIQKPWELPGVAIVLKGLQGIGKGQFAKWIREVLGIYYSEMADMRQFTSQYNGHLQNKLMVYVNEATWGGQKASASPLKAIITDPHCTIERKFQDPIDGYNYKRVLISSNEAWVVPRDLDDRRFFVIECNPMLKKHFTFFDEYNQALENGGAAALLWDLMNEDISDFNPREMPLRVDGFDQKLMGMNSAQLFLYECLGDEKLGLSMSDTPVEEWKSLQGRPNDTYLIEKTWVWDHYLQWCHENKAQVIIQNHFWIELRKILKELPTRKGSRTQGRRPMVEFPCLELARELFAMACEMPVSALWKTEPENA